LAKNEVGTKKNCDYVLALKENQPATYNDVKDYFSIEDKDFQDTLLRFETFDIGHSREEKDVIFRDDECQSLRKKYC